MAMSIQTISSFPPINNDQRLQTYNPKISVLAAVNKLKETQFKIVEQGNKEAVKRRINQAVKARENERQKSSLIKEAVRKSFEMDKTMREKSLQERMKEEKKLHQLASTLRQTRNQFKKEIKLAFRESSSHLYSQALSQRQKNQQLIKEFKEREMLLKQQKRLRMAQNMQKSRQKVKEFRQSRVVYIKRQREKDVQDLQRKMMARSRYLQRMSGDKGSTVDNDRSFEQIENDKRSQSFSLNTSSVINKQDGENCEQQQLKLIKKQ